MLMQIHIRDLATIEELQLNLLAGSTMITGETGAGKSIFIEAIELALGGRASANIIRSGKDKADISLTFDIAKFPKVIACLENLDLTLDSSECIIRRVITADGRSRCYVNGTPATLPLVKELGELLFHLHSQHEQQVLLKADTQREMLDRYADHLPLVQTVKHLAENYKATIQNIQILREKMAERTDRCDYLRFQLSELHSLKLQSGEWEELEAEHNRLSHSEELIQHLQLAVSSLTSDEKNVLGYLHDTRKALEAIQNVEPKAQEWLNTLELAYIHLNELESDLSNYLEKTELDPQKLQEVEARVSAIFNLSRKHKILPQDLAVFQIRLEGEFAELNMGDEELLRLEKQAHELQEQYKKFATELSSSRKNAATKFQAQITQTIRSLSLPYGDFQIELEEDQASLSIHGLEKITFLIKTNPDQAFQPLKVISGGELSRLSLAAHLALADKTTIPTLVFDEVDTGLSGATAEKIGKLIRALGDSYQVFCVTHQHQVAACGQHQLLVEKYFVGKSTHTRLRMLSHEERTKEIARMLGGEKITEKTLDHAREVLENA